MSRASEIAKSRAFFYVVAVGSLLMIVVVTAVSPFLPGLCGGLAEAGADCETTARFTRVLLIAGGVATVGEIVAIVRTQNPRTRSPGAK